MSSFCLKKSIKIKLYSYNNNQSSRLYGVGVLQKTPYPNVPCVIGLGTGNTQNYDTPQKVLENVKSVNSGNTTVCAITNDNSLYCWGENDFGQIGDGTKNNVNVPKKVLEDVKSVEVGFKHTCATKSNDDLYCWGYNQHNQTGVGNFDDVLQPTKVLTNVQQIVVTKYTLNIT